MKEKVKKPVGLKTRHVGEFGKGWQSPKVCWALVPRRIKLEASVRQKNGRIDEVWQVWNKKSTAGWDATHTKISEQ
jgi:hypothetical protein